MTKYISKEAKRLSQMKFKEKEPVQIQHTPQTKCWPQYWSSIDRNDLQLILENKDFEYMTSDEESIVVYFSKLETAEECQLRISKQHAEWNAYERRKKAFYADIAKQIQEAEEAEKLRRERFADPDYIELLRLKKKFGEL